MGRHAQSRHSSGVPKGKKIVGIVIVLVIAVAFVFGIYALIRNLNQENDIEGVINHFFEAIKNAEQEKVNQYADYEQLINSFDEMILQDESDEVKKELFKNIEWNIEDIEEQENQVVAIVEVKNKDFKNIITAWMKELVSAKSSGIEITNEYALEKLANELKQEESLKTVIKKIVLKKENDSWRIQVNEDLRDLVYPSIDSVISVLKSSKANIIVSKNHQI